MFYSLNRLKYNDFGVCGLPSAQDRVNRAQSLLSDANCNLLLDNVSLSQIGVFDDKNTNCGLISKQVKFVWFVCDLQVI